MNLEDWYYSSFSTARKDLQSPAQFHVQESVRAYQGVRNNRFRKIWRALFSCNTCFEIRPFCLVADELCNILQNT